MPYRVFLVDILNVIGSDDRRNEVKSILQSYFDPIAKTAKAKDGAFVSFVTDNPQPAKNELICYYTTFGWHVVTQIEDGKLSAPEDGGLTYSNGKVSGSDVFASADMDTRGLANLTFHELMHNKLKMGDEMHRLRGLASATVDDSMRPTAANNTIMAANLLKDRPQWVGGFQALKDRGKKVDWNAPIE